jgi:ABC-2 type transport system ATP-binding protein
MSEVVAVHALTKTFGDVAAVDNVSFTLEQNRIYGLLGRNGAGKTTLMHLLTGQQFATTGSIHVFGESPVENAGVLRRVCFIKESQRYPDAFEVRHVLQTARMLFPNWDDAYSDALVADFQLPRRRKVKKLSRGMLSALGVSVGLASRAPLTFFDEPYLGLDAVARQMFYDHLLADYAEHPRTVVLSTHLIDEVADLLEHILLIDRGRILLDQEADALRGEVAVVTGPDAAVAAISAGHDVLRRERLGALTRATVRGRIDGSSAQRAQADGLTVEPATLQQIIVRITTQNPDAVLTSEATR